MDNNWITMGGTWRIENDDRIFQGELHINSKMHRIILEIIIPNKTGHIMGDRFPYIGKIDYIRGSLFSGVEITLYQCQTGTCHISGDTRQTIFAQYAFWGLCIDSKEQLVFSKVCFNFGEIVEWSGLCKYRNEFHNGYQSLVWKHKEPIQIQLYDHCKATFHARQGGMHFEIFDCFYELSQSIIITLSYLQPVVWETVIEDLSQIKKLISLGIQQRVYLYQAEYFHQNNIIAFEDDSHELKRHSYEPAQEVFWGDSIEYTSSKQNKEWLFSLEEFSQIAVQEKWQEYRVKLQPILDLYYTMLNTDYFSPEMLFLNLTQALETFHSRFITDDIKDFLAKTEETFNRLYPQRKGDKIEKTWHDFLLKPDVDWSKARQITLRSRIADLIFCDGRILIMSPGEYSITDWVEKVSETRNYLTHYNPAKEKKSFAIKELSWVNSWLKLILDYHIMKVLGFDNEMLESKFCERRKNIHQYHELHGTTRNKQLKIT